MSYKCNIGEGHTKECMLRLEFLDVVGGVMVVWMIVSHVFQWSHLIECNVYTTASRFFFMFMAWFFFKGGMFAKERTSREDIKKWSHRLLLPFVVFTAIGMFFYWIQLYLMGDRSWIHYILSPIKAFLLSGSFPGNLPLWFLGTLFVVRTLFGLLVNRKYTDFVLAASLVALYLIKYEDLFHIREYMNYPYYIYNIFLGLIFYWIGYRLKNMQYCPYVALIGIAILLLVFVVPSFCDFRSSKVQGNFLLFVLSATIACIVVNNLFQILCKRIKFRLLSHIGKQSMFYFCTHWIFLIIIKITVVIPLNVVDPERLFMIYSVGLIILLPVSNKLLSAKLRSVLI